MMSERQRAKELEQLSAYLDGQLNETEQKQIESRLAAEPELQEMYAGLRNTKLLFGRVHRVHAPHSFALTPEMVKVRKQKLPSFATIRWATSLAAILLVVMFGAEFILSGSFAAKSEMADAPMLEYAMAEDQAAMEEEMPNEKAAVEPLIIWGAPASVGGFGGGGGGDTAAIGLGGGGDMDMYESMPVEPSGGGGEQVESTPTETPSALRTLDDGEGEDLILGINSEQAGQIVSTSEAPAAVPSSGWLANLTPIRWAEIGLGVFVLAGVILLLVRKKK